MKYLLPVLSAATLVAIAFAQNFNIEVPENLAVDVDSSTPDFFISYDGNAKEDGFISSAGGSVGGKKQ